MGRRPKHSWVYECPKCPKRVPSKRITVHIPLSEPPHCQKHTGKRAVKMRLIEGDEETAMAQGKAPPKKQNRNRQRHVIGKDCGYCKKVIKPGCAHGRPCPKCRGEKEPADVLFVYDVCDDCKKKKPWEEDGEQPEKEQIELQPVQSSNLHSVAYDGSHSTFYVRFHSGSLYKHTGVPSNIYAAFMRANSKGRFYNRNLKNEYPYERMQ